MSRLFIHPFLEEESRHQLQQQIRHLPGLQGIELTARETVCKLGTGTELSIGGSATNSELGQAHHYCWVKLREAGFKLGLY